MPQLNWDDAKHAASVGLALGLSAWASLSFAIQALIVLQALDVVTGILAAWANAEVDSRIGTAKLAKKAIAWVLVGVVAVLTPALGDVSLTLPALGSIGPVEALALYYAAMEALSIIENAGRAGVKFPTAIKDRLAQLNAEEPPHEPPA